MAAYDSLGNFYVQQFSIASEQPTMLMLLWKSKLICSHTAYPQIKRTQASWNFESRSLALSHGFENFLDII